MLVEHKKQWEFLKNKLERDQLSHAYLFAGLNQLGKKNLAKEFIKLINCKSEGNKPCGVCINCLAIEKNSFPDLMIIDSDNEREIQISKIREAQKFLSYKSYYGSFKSVIVDSAEKMNQEAQSCFLKTLEEPKGRTVLILVSSKPEMLLPTIVSRCQIIKFFGRPKISAERKEQENKILQEITSVISEDFSEKFKYVKSLDFSAQGGPASGGGKYSVQDVLEVLQKHFRDLLMVKIGLTGESCDYSTEKIKEIVKLIEDINFKITTTNANPKLALEVLLMQL